MKQSQSQVRALNEQQMRNRGRGSSSEQRQQEEELRHQLKMMEKINAKEAEVKAREARKQEQAEELMLSRLQSNAVERVPLKNHSFEEEQKDLARRLKDATAKWNEAKEEVRLIRERAARVAQEERELERVRVNFDHVTRHVQQAQHAHCLLKEELTLRSAFQGRLAANMTEIVAKHGPVVIIGPRRTESGLSPSPTSGGTSPPMASPARARSTLPSTTRRKPHGAYMPSTLLPAKAREGIPLSTASKMSMARARNDCTNSKARASHFSRQARAEQREASRLGGMCRSLGPKNDVLRRQLALLNKQTDELESRFNRSAGELRQLECSWNAEIANKIKSLERERAYKRKQSLTKVWRNGVESTHDVLAQEVETLRASLHGAVGRSHEMKRERAALRHHLDVLRSERLGGEQLPRRRRALPAEAKPARTSAAPEDAGEDGGNRDDFAEMQNVEGGGVSDGGGCNVGDGDGAGDDGDDGDGEGGCENNSDGGKVGCDNSDVDVVGNNMDGGKVGCGANNRGGGGVGWNDDSDDGAVGGNDNNTDGNNGGHCAKVGVDDCGDRSGDDGDAGGTVSSGAGRAGVLAGTRDNRGARSEGDRPADADGKLNNNDDTSGDGGEAAARPDTSQEGPAGSTTPAPAAAAHSGSGDDTSSIRPTHRADEDIGTVDEDMGVVVSRQRTARQEPAARVQERDVMLSPDPVPGGKWHRYTEVGAKNDDGLDAREHVSNHAANTDDEGGRRGAPVPAEGASGTGDSCDNSNLETAGRGGGGGPASLQPPRGQDEGAHDDIKWKQQEQTASLLQARLRGHKARRAGRES